MDSLTNVGVADAQRSASQSSRYLDTKPGDEVKEVTDLLAISELKIGVIAVSE